MHRRATKGFTLIEILIAIFILMLILAVSAATFQKISQASALRVSVQDAYLAITKARNDTLGSAGDTVYGIHIASTSISIFEGATYSAGDPSNEEYSFEGLVSATSSLTGDVVDVVFARLSGEASATGTISFIEPRSEASTTVTIYKSGLIE